MSPRPATEVQRWAWSVPECPFSIECAPSVLEQIRASVLEAFYSMPRGGVEIGGVLFGRYDGSRVEIVAFRPLSCEHALGPSFLLSARDHAALRELLRSASEEYGIRDLAPVGWHHSHTRSPIFLSDADLEIHRDYFPEPWQVALVLHPTSLGPLRAGFFFRDANGSIRANASYREFSLRSGVAVGLDLRIAHPEPEPGNGRPPLEEPATVEPVAEDAPAEAPPAPVAPISPAPDPQLELALYNTFPPPPDRPRRSRLAPAAVVLCILAAVAAFLARDYWIGYLFETAVPLGLHAMDVNGQLQIRWRVSGPLQQAAHGALAISDGSVHTTIPLDAQRLHAGKMEYSRQSPMVDVHMIVQLPNGKQAAEFTSFISTRLPDKTEPPRVAGETELMRADLEQQDSRNRALELGVERMQGMVRQQAGRVFVPPPPRKPSASPSLERPPAVSLPAVSQTLAVDLGSRPAPPPPPVVPPPAPQASYFQGQWHFPPAAASGSPFPPESVRLAVSEVNGLLQGTFTARYRVPKNAGFNPQVGFSFQGPARSGSAQFAWRSADGRTGKIELIPVPARDAVEVVWYADDNRLTFDDIFVRAR